MTEKEIIINNYKEFKEIAEYSFNNKKYNSSVTLYYKALVELCDIELSSKLDVIGSNHTERFEMLKTVAPDLYRISSRIFRFYRDSYNKKISETIAKLVKESVLDAEKIVFKDKKMD